MDRKVFDSAYVGTAGGRGVRAREGTDGELLINPQKGSAAARACAWMHLGGIASCGASHEAAGRCLRLSCSGASAGPLMQRGRHVRNLRFTAGAEADGCNAPAHA